ncbi:YceD family protein [Aquabacterium sp. OR-4]|uniref:YceD family protein n=1 Tax=Aquabacterium sp. OR-4 TaxID=2978127 RepID=UPI0021B2E5B0|nr:YceD family protein [Aquabacterium sp. OR-4]MDT7834510.1 YceD family protein [Aquabacterium sp. OR-4]
MKRQHDPLRLDVAAFAADGGALAGQWPGDSLVRLAESQSPPQDVPLGEVRWQVQGERRAVAGGEAELWLALSADTRVWLSCQRCLQPFEVPLALARRIRFVRGEAQAEALDAEIDDDVLALSRSIDLRELVEDELLLALPLVPRHSQCPMPLPMAADAASADDAPAERANPFAVLQSLKTDRGAS